MNIQFYKKGIWTINFNLKNDNSMTLKSRKSNSNVYISVFKKNGLKDFNEVWINKIKKKKFLTKWS